jgi:hypothetical protein
MITEAQVTQVLWWLVQAAVLALVSFGVPLLAKYVAAQVTLLNARAQSTGWGDLLYQLEAVAVTGVRAAEQALGPDNAQNAAKKAMVLKVVQAWLDSHNIHVDATVIDAAIEAAVFTEFNKGSKPAPVPPVAPAA